MAHPATSTVESGRCGELRRGEQDRNFTGVNQDIVASTGGGVYDFPMREYRPAEGRWWTPDPAGLAAVDPNNPQSWNRYAYVNGTPLNATDPLGLLVADGGTTTTEFCKPWIFEFNAGEGSLYTIYLGENCTLQTVFDGDAPPDSGGGGSGAAHDLNPGGLTSPKQCKESGYSEEPDFINANLQAATTVATQLGVTPAEILGLSAYESGWGWGTLAQHYGNWFGLSAGFPGQTGPTAVLAGHTFGEYASPGFLNSALSFAASRHGIAVEGITDPARFAAALRETGFNSETLSPPYANQLVQRIGDVLAAMALCF